MSENSIRVVKVAMNSHNRPGYEVIKDSRKVFESESEVEAHTRAAQLRFSADAAKVLKTLNYAHELIEIIIEKQHQDCRCQFCESLPMEIEKAIAILSEYGQPRFQRNTKKVTLSRWRSAAPS